MIRNFILYLKVVLLNDYIFTNIFHLFGHAKMYMYMVKVYSKMGLVSSVQAENKSIEQREI